MKLEGTVSLGIGTSVMGQVILEMSILDNSKIPTKISKLI